MSASIERPSSAADFAAPPDGLSSSQNESLATMTLASLPVGARFILRCRKDWRAATVAARSPEHITLSVGSPSGHTYRVKRPPDAPLLHDGSIPVLGEGSWRAGLVHYDTRW